MTDLTLYHGSHRQFDSFRIEESLSNHGDHILMEGHGIYMTTDFDLASGYGTYIYEVLLEEDDITDMTDEYTVRSLIEEIGRRVDVSFEQHLDLDPFIERVVSGDIQVTTLDEALIEMLDNTESFHLEYRDRITEEDDCVFEEIREAFSKEVTDIFRYYDTSFRQDIYICFRNPGNLPFETVHTLSE